MQKKTINTIAFFCACLLSSPAAIAQNKQENLYPFSKLQEISFEEVKVMDEFWLPKIRAIQTKGLPVLFDLAEQQGKIDNFRIIANKKKGKIKLYNAADSDVYKLLEDACFSLSQYWDSLLFERVDSIIDLIIAAQAVDGYLNTQYMLPLSDSASPSPDDKKVKTFGYGPDVKWKSLYSEWPYGYSQLYSAGHLMEAAYAHFKITKNDKFLKTAIKLADNIVSNFTKEKISNYGDHPEVEIGLMKMYELTGNQNYLNYANLFCRYVKFGRPVDLGNGINLKPLVLQTEAFGHCVRTAYIYSGATDVLRATGTADLQHALTSLWGNITGKKMYLHGGTGNGTNAEQHGADYDLPILNTYSESCAGIAQGQWNHRLNLLYGDAKFADLVEIEMYNNGLAAANEDGDKFFYSNKLNIDTVFRKNEQSGVRRTYLFCCPSKVPGMITGISRWAYAKDASGIYINQFIGSRVTTIIDGSELQLQTSTDYPWNGRLKGEIKKHTNSHLTIYIRIPSWAYANTHLPNSPYHFADAAQSRPFTIEVNGKIYKSIVIKNGYIAIRQNWKDGDCFEINFNIPVRRIYSKEIVTANRGRVALLRGPLLYGLEGADNSFDVLQFVLPPKNMIATTDKNIAGQKAVVLKGTGWNGNKEIEFTAIPYYLWQNRGVFQFATLLIEDDKKVKKEESNPNKKINTNG